MKTKRKQVSKSSHIQPGVLRMAQQSPTECHRSVLLRTVPLQGEEQAWGHHLTTWLL